MPNNDLQGIGGSGSEVDIVINAGAISRAIAKHMHDPMPPINPLDQFTDAALLADYAAQVTLDQSPTTQAYADEILRRMAR